MTLYLAEFDMETVHDPGTDGMTKRYDKREIRIVDSMSEEGAWRKLKATIERYEPYNIRISVIPLKINAVII